MSVPYVINNNFCTIIGPEGQITVDLKHKNYTKIINALRNKDSWDDIKKLFAPAQTYDIPVNPNFDEYVNLLSKYDLDISYLKEFMHNLMQNPTFKALKDEALLSAISKTKIDEMVHGLIDSLFGFLCTKNLPLTPDGCFLAYKAVREDYYDIHSGTVLNKPGVPIERLKRDQVDPDADKECSRGYHVGTYGYAKSFGSIGSTSNKLLIVKVNPADIVSFGKGCYEKLRVCYYTIVSEYKEIVVPLPTIEGKEVVVKGFEEFLITDPKKGDELAFNYTKLDEVVAETRYGRVIEVTDTDLFCELIAPEQNRDLIRRFLRSRIENMILLN